MATSSSSTEEAEEPLEVYSWGTAPAHLKTEKQLRDEHQKTGGPIRAILLMDPPTPLFDVAEAVTLGAD